MKNEYLTYFETRLQKQIEELDAQIKMLSDEKYALARQLAKARAERTGLQTVTRKNSIDRVLAENCIIEALRESKGSLTSQKLYNAAQQTNYDLKENTFRTYLHRMKKRGAIKTAKFVGHWELIDDKK